MPNNQNFLLVLWNDAPWMIPLLALSWAGMISLLMRFRMSNDHATVTRLGWHRFVNFMAIGSVGGSVLSLVFMREPAFLGYLLAFTCFGMLIGSYCAWLCSDPNGMLCGVTIGVSISIAYLVLHLLSVRRGGGADSDMPLVVFISFALVVSALFGPKNRFRLSFKNRPYWYCLNDAARNDK